MHMPLLKELQLKYNELKKQIPKGQVTGESISLNDSSDLPYEDFKINGKSEQETGEDTPSPEKLSPIKSVADDVNLFDEEWEGTVSKNFIPVVAGEECIYSEQNVGTNVFYDFYETKESEAQANFCRENVSFKPEKNGFIKIRKSTTSKIKCKLQKGSKITPYSVFGKGTVKINNHNKNYLNAPKQLTFTQSKWIKCNIPAGTYHITCGNVSYSGKRPPVIVFPKNGNLNKNLTENRDVVVTLENDETSTIGFYSNGFDATGSIGIEATIENLMISKDGGEYEEYQGQDVVIQTAPLRSLPNRVYDEKDGNKTIRNIKELALDGTESWKYDTSLKIFSLTSLSSEIKKSKENNDILIMSNFFKGETVNNCIKDDYDNCIGVNIYGNILLKCNKFNGETNELKAFLTGEKEKGTPVKICYALAEPVIEAEPCEELKNLHSYKNITNVTTEGDIKPTLDVTYFKDLETLFKNLEK